MNIFQQTFLEHKEEIEAWLEVDNKFFDFLNSVFLHSKLIKETDNFEAFLKTHLDGEIEMLRVNYDLEAPEYLEIENGIFLSGDKEHNMVRRFSHEQEGLVHRMFKTLVYLTWSKRMQVS